jgi:hypothetical protein
MTGQFGSLDPDPCARAPRQIRAVDQRVTQRRLGQDRGIRTRENGSSSADLRSDGRRGAFLPKALALRVRLVLKNGRRSIQGLGDEARPCYAQQWSKENPCQDQQMKRSFGLGQPDCSRNTASRHVIISAMVSP